MSLRGPQKTSLAQRVRDAVADLSQACRECSTDAISIKLGIMSRAERKRVLNTLCDLRKRGHLQRLRHGVYQLVPQHRPPEKRQVMWRLLRMRRAVTIDDLTELAGVKPGYAAEWLRALTRQGVVRRTGAVYRLLKDSIEMPELTETAERLRALREKKKQAASKALAAASSAIETARAAINQL